MSGADRTAEAPSGVDPKLLELLICPVSRTMLVYDREAAELVSKKAGLAYPIVNGVPIMRESEARPIES